MPLRVEVASPVSKLVLTAVMKMVFTIHFCSSKCENEHEVFFQEVFSVSEHLSEGRLGFGHL